jgi:hypothetical protein
MLAAQAPGVLVRVVMREAMDQKPLGVGMAGMVAIQVEGQEIILAVLLAKGTAAAEKEDMAVQ